MFRIILFLLLLLPANVFAYECSKEIDEFSKEINIKIICNPENKSITEDKDVYGKIPNQIELKKFFVSLKQFIQSYSVSFLNKNLDEIILLEGLKYEGEDVGGLSDGRKIFICVEDLGFNYHEIYLKALHHEISSNIYRTKIFKNSLEWSGFSRNFYDLKREFFIRCLHDQYFAKVASEKNYVEGFIINYSKTNPENDFNSYAEYLFVFPSKINVLKKYKKISTKLEFVKKLYRINGFTGKFPDETWQITIAGLV